MTKTLGKKGALGGPLAALVYGAIAVLVVVMVVAFGQQFLVTTQGSFTTNSAAFNSTTQGITGLGTFSSNIGTIALALVLLVIIGLLIGVASGRI